MKDKLYKYHETGNSNMPERKLLLVGTPTGYDHLYRYFKEMRDKVDRELVVIPSKPFLGVDKAYPNSDKTVEISINIEGNPSNENIADEINKIIFGENNEL